MIKINYDFTGLSDALGAIKENGTATSENLRSIKTELNRFFTDSACKDVLFTNNVDKMFFGAKVIAMINPDDIYEYLMDDEAKRIGSYIIELDSHLFDPVLDLSPGELTAVILHEVGHMVADAEPIENARKALNVYLAANKEHIKMTDSIHYKEILAYGLKDYLSKTQSMFYIDDKSEIYADEFAVAYKFDRELSRAYDKIVRNNMKLYENSEISKFITFGWALSIYKNLKIRRIGAIKTLLRAKILTGSRLEQLEIENVIRRINRIDDAALIESAMSDRIRLRLKEKMKKHRINNLRTIDDTFYELSMRVKNVEDEDEALYIMRQLNNCISIIEEYRTTKDCDDYEIAQWDESMKRFIDLREKLSNSVIYKDKNYGLFVNYPDIMMQ